MSAASDLAPALSRRGRRGGEGVLARLKRWRLRGEGRRLLLDFDDRMLRDLGICPAQAEFEARKPFWRE